MIEQRAIVLEGPMPAAEDERPRRSRPARQGRRQVRQRSAEENLLDEAPLNPYAFTEWWEANNTRIPEARGFSTFELRLAERFALHEPDRYGLCPVDLPREAGTYDVFMAMAPSHTALWITWAILLPCTPYTNAHGFRERKMLETGDWNNKRTCLFRGPEEFELALDWAASLNAARRTRTQGQ